MHKTRLTHNSLFKLHKRPFAFSNMLFTRQREPENFYQVLKVKTTSTQKDIKLAYYKMAKKHHPDFQQHATDKDKELA